MYPNTNIDLFGRTQRAFLIASRHEKIPSKHIFLTYIAEAGTPLINVKGN